MTLTQAKSKITRMKKLLEEMTWEFYGGSPGGEMCTWCGEERPGHKDTCKLAKELK